MTSPPPLAPPGWYQDPSAQHWLWWDGYRWVLPAPPVVAEPDETWFPHITPLPMAAAWLAIGFMVVTTIAGQLLGALDETSLIAGLLSLALLVVGTVGMPVTAWFASWRWGTRRFVADLGLRFRWIDIPLGIAAAFGLMITLIVINVITTLIGLPKGSNLNDVAENGRSVGVFVYLLVLAGVVAPITEEILLRGVMLRGLLSRFGGWIAVVIQAVIFGAAHFTAGEGWGNIDLIVSLSVMGFGLGFLAKLTGRLGTGIVAHAVFNLTQIGLLWLSLG